MTDSDTVKCMVALFADQPFILEKGMPKYTAVEISRMMNLPERVVRDLLIEEGIGNQRELISARSTGGYFLAHNIDEANAELERLEKRNQGFYRHRGYYRTAMNEKFATPLQQLELI